MIVQTKYLGEVKINAQDILHFSSGLPGFQAETDFIILNIADNDVLQILQSVNTPSLAFLIANPHVFYKDYSFKLDDPTIDSLKIGVEQDLIIYSIITLKDPFDLSTINLKAPLVINRELKLGKQYILKSDEYPLKASISSVAVSDEKGV